MCSCCGDCGETQESSPRGGEDEGMRDGAEPGMRVVAVALILLAVIVTAFAVADRVESYVWGPCGFFGVQDPATGQWDRIGE